jgi:uncharacterized SAM-binding protein YcdF (DUF218 family)
VIRRTASALLLVWLIGFVLFVGLLPRPAAEGRTDAIIVLTGGAKRIERGLDLLAAGQAKRMLISGVDPTVRPVDLAERYRVPLARFQCCIDLGTEAVDTRSNGEEAADWVRKGRYRSIRLVTTDWHMRRADFELRQAMPKDVRILRDAVRSDADLRVLFTEYNKYLLRRAAVLFGI